MKKDSVGVKILYITIFLCLFTCFIIPRTFAGEGTQENHISYLEKITITETPIIEGNKIDRYSSQKTTVTEKQIEDLNAQDLGTALRMAPGVNISRYNIIGSFGGASGGAVFIRGMGSSRPGAEIKTTVDGIPMYMSVWNHPLLDLMSIDAAFSIEVYKSPQPHVFGNAFGIINIVPKEQKSEGITARAKVAGGSYGTFVGKAEHGGKWKNIDYYLGGGYRRSEGHRDDADGELKDFYGRIGYKLSDTWNLSFFTMWNDNYADDPGIEGSDPDTRKGRYETRTWLIMAKLENHSDIADGYIKLYRNAGEGDWLNQPTQKPEIKENLFNDFEFYGIKIKETLHFFKGNEIIAGIDWDVTEGDYDKTFSDGTHDRWEGHDFAITSPYFAVSQQLGNKNGFFAIPSAGFRFYHNSDFDSEWSPHAGLILGYKQTEFHAGYARGIIYPGLDVVVFSEKIIPPLGSSWKDLEPEKVDHYEIGLKHRFGSFAVADITWFYDDGKDRYVIIPPPPPPPVYSNVEKYRIKGIEATASIYPTNNISLFAGFTWMDTSPSDLPYAPEVTFSAGVNWQFKENFRISLDCEYVDKMHVDAQLRKQGAKNSTTVDSYFLLNGRFGYTFHIPSFPLEGEAFLAIENLTNTDYEYLPGYPMPGTTAMLGINLKF